jgi:hypothetical protein
MFDFPFANQIHFEEKPMKSNTLLSILFIFSILSGLIARTARADTPFTVSTITGKDDLRGGNQAFVSLLLVGGATTPEVAFNTSGLERGTFTTSLIFPGTITRANISGINIRHDGNPRNGHPFDTYDNWDMRQFMFGGFFTTLSDPSFHSAALLPVGHRFTDQKRSVFIRLRGEGADFVITGLTRAGRGPRVVIRNIGDAEGAMTGLSCRTATAIVYLPASANFLPGVSREFTPALPTGGAITCQVNGRQIGGLPEVVISNNIRRLSF